jgi:hypothetical protein
LLTSPIGCCISIVASDSDVMVCRGALDGNLDLKLFRRDSSRRVYGEWLGSGLSRSVLCSMDIKQFSCC